MLCLATTQCCSGFCRDGYCCNSGCSGQCNSCNVAGSQGTCTGNCGSIQGTITDYTTGNPLENARVDLTNSGGASVYTLNTDANGAYSSTVIVDTYNVFVSRPGYNPNGISNIIVNNGDSKIINIVLMPLSPKLSKCEADCTYTDDTLCHSECQGVNDCWFFDDTSKAGCNGK
jgi:hypothetical protein